MKHNPDKLFTGKVLLFNGVLHSRKEFGPFCTMLLSANSTKWLKTLEQFVGSSREIVWVCLAILRFWDLKRVFFLFISILTSFNPYHTTGLLLCSLGLSENQSLSEVFRGYGKRLVAWNGATNSCFKYCLTSK